MTLKDIRDECWAIARETAEVDQDRLWTKREMDIYINRIYKHIARETKCIKDSITSSLCKITVAPPADLAALTALAATDEWYAQDLAWYNSADSWLNGHIVTPYSLPLDPRILDVDEVKWTKFQWRLTKVSVSKWRGNPYWEQIIGSMATEFCTDGSNNRLFLNYRMAGISDTLRLVVTRLPLVDLAQDTDTTEFRTGYNDYFKNGVLWQMYSKQDTETIDIKKASSYYAEFIKDLDKIKQEETYLNNRLRVNNSMAAFR